MFNSFFLLQRRDRTRTSGATKQTVTHDAGDWGTHGLDTMTSPRAHVTRGTRARHTDVMVDLTWLAMRDEIGVFYGCDDVCETLTPYKTTELWRPPTVYLALELFELVLHQCFFFFFFCQNNLFAKKILLHFYSLYISIQRWAHML